MPTTVAPPQVGFKRILVPTDFSAVSDHALAYAKSIARFDDATILLAHCTEPVNPISTPEMIWYDRFICEREGERPEESELESCANILRAQAFQVKTSFTVGTVKDTLPSLVQCNDVSLIVMGTHARTGVARLFMGSATEAAVRIGACPLLVVGPEVLAEADQWPPRKILCVSDIRLESVAEATYAGNLARVLGAEFSILHVGDPEGRSATLQQQLHFSDALRDASKGTAQPSFFNRGLDSGHTMASTIADVAEKWSFDLIVMSSVAEVSTGTQLRCGVLTQVMARAKCPVMVLPKTM